MYRIGDEVAVLVTPNEVRQLARIVHVGPAVVELDSGGLFFLDDGKAMHDVTYIKPATDEHRAAVTANWQAGDAQRRESARPATHPAVALFSPVCNARP